MGRFVSRCVAHTVYSVGISSIQNSFGIKCHILNHAELWPVWFHFECL